MNGDLIDSTNNPMSFPIAIGAGKIVIPSIAIECYICVFDFK
jgi:hypothetical protein